MIRWGRQTFSARRLSSAALAIAAVTGAGCIVLAPSFEPCSEYSESDTRCADSVVERCTERDGEKVWLPVEECALSYTEGCTCVEDFEWNLAQCVADGWLCDGETIYN